MHQIHRDCPAARMETLFRQDQRDLQKPLRPGEVGAEVRAERVSTPGCACNLATVFVQKRVVQDGYEGQRPGNLIACVVSDWGKKLSWTDPFLFKQTVGRAPVGKLLATGAEQSRDSTSSETG